MKLAKLIEKSRAIEKDSRIQDSDWEHAIGDITRGNACIVAQEKLMKEHNDLSNLSEYETYPGTETDKVHSLQTRKDALEKGLKQLNPIVSPLVGMYCLRMQAKAEAAAVEETTGADADKGNNA